jgi:hypothetical protein
MFPDPKMGLNLWFLLAHTVWTMGYEETMGFIHYLAVTFKVTTPNVWVISPNGLVGVQL